ncbi:MAG: hypothetical protein ACK4PC_08470 [Sphingopyxis sp.]
MKITRADGSVIEGTAEELAQYEAFSRFHGPSGDSSKAQSFDAQLSDPGDVDWEFVSTDVAFRALTRIKLGAETKAVIRKIYDGGDSWTPASVLQKEIGYSANQFAGLMGAFGRRLVNTPGFVLHSAFFEQEWDDGRSCFLYRLPPSVRPAVEKARIVDRYDL